MLSSFPPALCAVLYCYIHSRTDFNFWVIRSFKFLMKLTYTLVKNHNNPSIAWLCYCSCLCVWGLGKESASPLHDRQHLHLQEFVNCADGAEGDGSIGVSSVMHFGLENRKTTWNANNVLEHVGLAQVRPADICHLYPLSYAQLLLHSGNLAASKWSTTATSLFKNKWSW